MGMENNLLSKPKFLNCNGQLMNLSVPKIMGILNVTPDSFYDGNRYFSEKEIRKHIETMIDDGADIIDIGAVSSRPNAEILNEAQEWERLQKVLPLIKTYLPQVCFSLDSFRAAIAKRAVEEYGIGIINDISAGNMDKTIFKTVAALGVPYIMMHMQGTPQTMQKNPHYKDVTQDIIRFFAQKVAELKLLGINDIIIDPGFGFGKTLDHNYQLMAELSDFKIFELPLLVGISRKSMIFRLLNITPEESLSGTIALNTVALLNGANILRVHDVKEAVQVVEVVAKIKTS